MDDSDASPGSAPDAAWDELINARLRRIGAFPFRAKFHLRTFERDYLARRGMPVMREHAAGFVAERLAPALPHRDGSQTPWGGHPVFVAQHATATCCRSCLQRNHDIARGRPLTEREQRYVVAVICRWIERDLQRVPASGRDGRAPRRMPAQDSLLP